MKIYGIHPVEELLGAAPEAVTAVYYNKRESGRLDEIFERAGTYGIGCHAVDHQELDGMAEGDNHQGVVAQTSEFEYTALEDLVASTSEADRAGILVLDQVQDVGNLGAILRSAAGLGFDGVVIPKDRAAPVTPAVVRTSAGCAFRIPVARVTNVARALEAMKDGGYWIVGTRQEEADPAWEVDFGMKAGIVMGGEHGGVRRLVDETCDLYATIPMAAGVESLNVAAASALMMYEARRQWERGE